MKNNGINIAEWSVALSHQKLFYMAVIDKQAHLTFVNSHFFKSFQRTAASIGNKVFGDFLHTEDLHRFQYALQTALSDNQPLTIETRMKGGQCKWVKWEINKMEATGKILCLGYDLAGEEQLKEYSRIAGQNYQTIVEGLDIGIIFQDKDGKVVAANCKAAGILGISLEDFYSDNYIFHLWKTAETNNDPGHKARSSFMTMLLASQRPAGKVMEWITPDGNERTIRWNAQPIYEGDQSEPFSVVFTLQDITKEKKLEKEVKAREVLFTSFMDHSPYYSWIADEEGTLLYANQPMLTYFQADQQAIGNNFSSLLGPCLAEAFQEKITLVFRLGQPDHSIIKSTMADGNEHVFQLTVFPIKGISSSLVIGGKALDITESYNKIRKLEDQLVQQRLRQQTRIAESIIHAQQEERARIGHELHDNVNQILTSAHLYMSLLAPDNLEFEEIKNKATEIVLLAIEEIRLLSKDMVMPDFKEDGLVGSIGHLVDDLRYAKLFTIDFTHNDKWGIELLDQNKKITLFRIVQEQTKNIIRYSKAKNVEISLHRTDDQIRLLIKDDGQGFDAATTRRGLGLSNIYERTRLYNGKVRLNTAPGKGCALIINIPLEGVPC